MAHKHSKHGKQHSIKRVSIVFACHLDVGFHSDGIEPGFDNHVLSRYFNQHFPNAIRVAQQLRDRDDGAAAGGKEGGGERLVFLTHASTPQAPCLG